MIDHPDNSEPKQYCYFYAMSIYQGRIDMPSEFEGHTTSLGGSSEER